MAKFIPYNYNQSSMVVINFNDQIQTGTFEHALHHLVDNKLDLSCFAVDFKNDDNGRPAYRQNNWTAMILSLKNKPFIRLQKGRK